MTTLLTPPTVRVEQWQSDEGGATYTDFSAGDGPMKAMIGTCGGEKAGIELRIGKRPMNEKVSEVLTLADVRQLRDNLTALLNHEHIADAFGDTSLLSDPRV